MHDTTASHHPAVFDCSSGRTISPQTDPTALAFLNSGSADVSNVTQHPFMTDEIWQFLEAGLGEYVLGDPFCNALLPDSTYDNDSREDG